MKTRIKQNQRAFTMPELLIVTFIIAAAVLVLIPRVYYRPRQTVHRISCVNDLKEIGIAYRLWANDNGDLVPPQQSIAKGGWKEFLTNADQGALCWTNYAILQNEMGQSPKLVVCPQDERTAATIFTNGFGNTNVSYFIGVSANDVFPQSIAGGDRNLCDASLPATDYGYSPTNGAGNDVAVKTVMRFNVTAWSRKIHSAGKLLGNGNILLGDGSAQQCSSAALRATWLAHAEPTTNWPVGHIPPVPSIRLVFP